LCKEAENVVTLHTADILTRLEFIVSPSVTALDHKENKNRHYRFLNLKIKFVYFLYIGAGIAQSV
jgi:hypothetical protein